MSRFWDRMMLSWIGLAWAALAFTLMDHAEAIGIALPLLVMAVAAGFLGLAASLEPRA